MLFLFLYRKIVTWALGPALVPARTVREKVIGSVAKIICESYVLSMDAAALAIVTYFVAQFLLMLLGVTDGLAVVLYGLAAAGFVFSYMMNSLTGLIACILTFYAVSRDGVYVFRALQDN